MESKPIEKNGPLKALGRAISNSLSYLKVLIVLGLLIFGLILVIDEFVGEKVVIDLIEVPKELSEQAITNVAVTRQLVDAAYSFAHQGYNDKYAGNYRLKRLPSRSEDHTEDDENARSISKGFANKPEPDMAREISKGFKAEAPSREISAISGLRVEPFILSGSKQEPDIQVPTIGSVRAFVRYFKKVLWKSTDVHITGEITKQNKKGTYRLVLRSSTSSALQPAFIQEAMNINEVINKSGEALLKLAYPCIAASSYYRGEEGTGSFANTSQLIGSCRKDRKDVKYIADLLTALITYEENPGQPGKAYKHFKAAIDSAPEERKKGDVYFHWGKVLERDNKPEQAKAMFNKAKEADQDNIRAYIELAIIETGKSGLASAHDQLQEVWRRHPQKKPKIHVEFGNKLLDKKRPDDAIKEYEKAIALKKNHVVAHNNLGIAHYNRGNYAEAIKAYKTAIKFDKDFIYAYYNWGIALNMLDEKDETKMLDLIRQYKLVLKENSGPNKGYFLSGVAYLKTKKPQEAINDFKEYDNWKTNSDFPALPAFYSKWGDALVQLAEQAKTYKKGDELRREAIKKYEKALEIDNNYHLANYKLSIAYYILGEKREKLKRAPVKKLIYKGDEYYKKWEAARQKYRLNAEPKRGLSAELVSQLEPPLPQPPDRLGSGVGLFRRILLWAAALVVLLAGGLVIVIYNSKGKLRERLRQGHKITPPPVPPEIPSEKPTSPEVNDLLTDEVISSTPQRYTQVGGFPAPSHHRPAAILLGTTGTLHGRQFLVEKEICRIGADRKNDLSIPDDDYVSGKHAQLRYENGKIIIFDTGSRNGTFVNEERVLETGRILFPGDRIQVGNTIFEVLDT